MHIYAWVLIYPMLQSNASLSLLASLATTSFRLSNGTESDDGLYNCYIASLTQPR